MLPDYEDIRALTDQPPRWHDNNGVPRYAPFHPDLLGVYDRFAVLAEIACQGCSEHMLVGCGWPAYSLHPQVKTHTIEDLARGFGYGDPPRHGCVGDSMSSISVRIVEAWDHTTWEWVRRPEFELADIEQDWAREPVVEVSADELAGLARELGLYDPTDGPEEEP